MENSVLSEKVRSGILKKDHSGHPPFFAGEVEPPTRFSKRGGLTGPQLLEGGCWERRS